MRAQLDVFGQLEAQQRIALLQMPDAKRRRLLASMARQVRVNSRSRIRRQIDLSGQPFEQRKSKSGKKMLVGLSKKIQITSTAEEATVGFKGVAGRIARKQQDGIDEVMTAEKMQRIHGQPKYDEPCTREQAKALRLEGFKKRKPSGKGYRNASIRELMETLTMGQAGVILRHMRDEVSKKKWVIPLPARAFLGATDAEVEKVTDLAMKAFNPGAAG